MNYPESFVAKITGAYGEEGKQWLDRLHIIIENYTDNWNLSIQHPVDNLSYNYVLNVTQLDGTPAILKIGVPNWDFSNEINTLVTYNGKGSVKLLRYDYENGVMLLEKVSPGNMLFELPEEEAIEQFVNVWRQLPRTANSALSMTEISTWFSAFDRYLESEYVEEYPLQDTVLEAKTFTQEFKGLTNEQYLLHGDLHHENILFSDKKGWTVIDPKGVIGNPYFDFTSFMVNHIPKDKDINQVLYNRLSKISDLLHLDKSQLIKASFIMSTLSACWSIEDKDPNWETSYRCAQYFQSLLQQQ